VLLEGMAAGCVPVASDLPGVRAVAGQSGMLVPPGDATALRRTLLHLARNRDILTERAAQSVRCAEETSLQATAQLQEAVFQSAVQRVLNRRATAVLPERWSDEHELLDPIADCVGTERVNISPEPTRAQPPSDKRDRSFTPWAEAPLVSDDAHHETAVLIGSWKAP
jgi:Glycosyl transferases group 1